MLASHLIPSSVSDFPDPLKNISFIAALLESGSIQVCTLRLVDESLKFLLMCNIFLTFPLKMPFNY